VDVEVGPRQWNEHREREDDERGEQALQRAGDHLGDRDDADRKRRQHAVLDLAGIPELLDQWHADGEDALEEGHDREHPGKERCGDLRRAGAIGETLADLGTDVAERETRTAAAARWCAR
jgi:hypothetical protein